MSKPPARFRACAQVRSYIGRQLQHVLDSTADDRRRDVAGNRLGRAIERQDATLTIRRGKAAREAVDDVLAERLQVGDLTRGALEMRAGSLESIRK